MNWIVMFVITVMVLMVVDEITSTWIRVKFGNLNRKKDERSE